ncbi:MAG: tRNA 2-thiouridine(34) synthase MnmA [Actinobacteria bacterium]|nr:tRNA 2-thiouridine(34) synthase MnmA [Actinomycetota bacterium]
MRDCMVGMSGGVDSSVAALLLQRQGLDVCGATLRLFSNEDIHLDDTHTCCSLDDVEDAARVARKLGIEHYTFNFRDKFYTEVIDRFVGSYKEGSTPNPCIDCNRFVKFPLLLNRARELEYSHIATGHYARIGYDEGTGRFTLSKARDATKDQSYMLYVLSQDILAHTYLPLGDYTKVEVREIAEEAGLANARKPESQDICFIKEGDYVAFLEEYADVKPVPGDIINTSGLVCGRHEGLHRYTIGQRKGIGVAAEKPYYVVAKDYARNALIIGDTSDLGRPDCQVAGVNWVSIEKPTKPLRVLVKTRYRQVAVPAMVDAQDEGVHVMFDEPMAAIASGQACVLYDGDLVLGGGTIL